MTSTVNEDEEKFIPCRAMPDRSCHYIPHRAGTNNQGEPVFRNICGNCGKIMPGGELFVQSQGS